MQSEQNNQSEQLNQKITWILPNNETNNIKTEVEIKFNFLKKLLFLLLINVSKNNKINPKDKKYWK